MNATTASEPTVLVVEDERVILLDLRRTLRRLGYPCIVSATSGVEALQVAEASPPGIVLMDLHLGDKSMDGIETAERLRARFDFGLIYLTGSVNEQQKARAESTRPDAWLLKPYVSDKLQEALQAAAAQLSRRGSVVGRP